MTRQYLSMVKVEDYTEDDDRLSTAGGGPLSPGVIQNPYYQFFLLVFYNNLLYSNPKQLNWI